jgi:hypothetical protein
MRWSLQAREARRLETNAQASKEIRRRSRAMRSRMTCGFVVQQHLISPSAIDTTADDGIESTDGAVAVGPDDWLFTPAFAYCRRLNSDGGSVSSRRS